MPKELSNQERNENAGKFKPITITDVFNVCPEIIDVLLMDNTTKKNIVWGTENYKNRGKGFGSDDHIMRNHLLAKGKLIKPRIEKSKSEQTRRSKDNAEVFTPSWIVNKQNNLADEAWFGHESPFNAENPDNTWAEKADPIAFDGDKTWMDYVNDVRLEVCCGEAPYLVSRYDAVSGEIIDTRQRIGLLDRKFRVISENASCDEEWAVWAIKAMKSVYGYEFQGDNLVIARENVLLDFLDYYFERFGEMPNKQLLLQVAEIISWNLWQMDGLKLVVPFSCHNEEPRPVQLSLFGDETPMKPELCPGCKDNDQKKHNGKRCYVMDWEKNKKVKFVSLMWRNGSYVG